jgi:putative transposase
MGHVRGAPCHPQTQGKIERWHQTLKNRILLENYYLPGDLEAKIDAFVDHYNHRRYHESLGNLTPLTSTLDAPKPSCWNEKGSNETQSEIAACNTKRTPHKISRQMSRVLH